MTSTNNYNYNDVYDCNYDNNDNDGNDDDNSY